MDNDKRGTSTAGELVGVLAKSNINIIDIDDDYIFFEFQFKMSDGRGKWCRSVYHRRGNTTFNDELLDLVDVVNEARSRVEVPYEQ